MLNYSEIEKYDISGMHKVYDNWPKIARDAYESDLDPVVFQNIDHIVFLGMGGSGAMADIFHSILSKTDIHISIVKGYLLPKTVDSQTLVIATSASGNTIETISSLKDSLNLKCKKIAFASGGQLEIFCKKNNIEFRKVPLFNNPRTSLPVYVYSIIKVLNSILPISPLEIEESLDNLDSLSKKISSTNLSASNPSLNLAQWISDISMILYPSGLQAAVIRFKNSIQENMKCHAMIEDIIEFCHNGIVAWEKQSKVKPILVQGTDDFIKTKERWKIIKEFFDKNNIEYWEIMSLNGNILTKIINLVYLLDYATIYRSVIDKTDPHPVKSIDFIKKRL